MSVSSYGRGVFEFLLLRYAVTPFPNRRETEIPISKEPSTASPVVFFISPSVAELHAFVRELLPRARPARAKAVAALLLKNPLSSCGRGCGKDSFLAIKSSIDLRWKFVNSQFLIR